MFDKTTLPKIIFPEIEEYENAKIIKEKDGVTRLYVDNQEWMEEVVEEMGTALEMYPLYDLANGNVLISGWGMGILPEWIANKNEVKSVTVVEKNESVVKLYLKNNKINEKINIIIDDMNNFSTNDEYDCLLLDHYQYESNDYKIENIKQVYKNVPNHKLIYAWSIEYIYLEKIFNNRFELLMDQENRWHNFKNFMKIETLPELSLAKVLDYVCIATNRKSYKEMYK